MKTAQERRQIKDGMEQTRLREVHTTSCTVLPNRFIMLDRMPKHARVAEIGVAFGDFSKEILARCQPEKLYLVDAWESDR